MKINRQIKPRINPPIKLGIKKIVLNGLLIFNPLVTNIASEKPIIFIDNTETTTNLIVNLNESINEESLNIAI